MSANNGSSCWSLTNLRNAWREMRDSAHVALTGTVRPDLPAEDAERIRRQMAICLEGRGEEVSARARAADLGRIYLALNPGGRKIFLEMLACFGIDDSELDTAAQNLLSAADPAAKMTASKRLRRWGFFANSARCRTALSSWSICAPSCVKLKVMINPWRRSMRI
jgi:hypothetical protein